MIPARVRVSRLSRSALAFGSLLSLLSFGSLGHAGGFDCPKSRPFLSMNGGLFKPGPSGALAKPVRILAIGSSSTEGVGTSAPRFAYPAQLQDYLARTWGIATDITNAGIGGETADATIARLRAALRHDRPNLVIWQVGTNDAMSGSDEMRFRKLLQDGIDSVMQAKIGLVLLDPQYLPNVKNGARYQRFIDDIASSGIKEKVPVFSRYAMMKAWAAGQSGDALTPMFSKDHFHMSDRGYACLAQRLAGDLADQWGKSIHLIGESQPALTKPVVVKGQTQAVVIVPKG